MLDDKDRANFLETLSYLHNYRIRSGMPNQIRTVYADLLNKRAEFEDNAMAAHAAAPEPVAQGMDVDDAEAADEIIIDDPVIGMLEAHLG